MSCNCNMNSNMQNSDLIDYDNFINNNMDLNLENMENNCSCGFDDDSLFPDNVMFGHCYVPNQRMTKTFSPEQALRKGTSFPELVSPYCPNQSIEIIEYLKSKNEIGKGCNE